jgi:phosphatidylserine/phosphatidylglycerophosphate/cardiolipin synthase-like enzyme
MRERIVNGPWSVRAIAGAHVVLLAINVDESRWRDVTAGLLGFAIERSELDNSKVIERYWLRGMKKFEDVDRGISPGTPLPLSEHPAQTFQWGDYTPKPGRTYVYRVVPVRGKPKNLVLDNDSSVMIKIQTENEEAGTHAVYFNRGVAASQAYARKFLDPNPDENNPDSPQMKWLSRGLYEALLNFIGLASSPEHKLRGSFYEFRYLPVGLAFKRAIEAGADVQILFDGVSKDYASKNSSMASQADIFDNCRPRLGNKSAEKHNKFLILIENNKPVAVWTGSTNISAGGIFGHSNVGHIVRDTVTAQKYLDYWQRLWERPDLKAAVLRDLDEKQTQTLKNVPPKSITALFSPRELPTLDWYADLMDSARQIVCFTVAFTIHPVFQDILKKENNVLRYVLKDKSSPNDQDICRDRDLVLVAGSKFEKGEFPGWLGEQLTGFNRNLYIHDKFMLVDPLSDDPIVVTGSANFSQASTTENDENMLIIRGDTRVADIYFGEFMRIFDHVYARYIWKRLQNKIPGEITKNFLKPDSSWVEANFEDGPKSRRRQYFAGEK